MSSDNPFAKLTSIDQRLFTKSSPSTPQPSKETVPETDATPPAVSQVSPMRKRQKPDTTAARHRDTTTPRYHDTLIPRHYDTETSEDNLSVFEAIRRAVKQFGKESGTYRLTTEEKQSLKKIEHAYELKGIYTSKNELTRIAINYLLEDYRAKGDKSIFARLLQLLHT